METTDSKEASQGLIPRVYESYVREARAALDDVNARITSIEQEMSARTASALQELSEERRDIAHQLMAIELQLVEINGEYEKDLALVERLRSDQKRNSGLLSRLIPGLFSNRDAINDAEDRIAALNRMLRLAPIRRTQLNRRIDWLNASIDATIEDAKDPEMCSELDALKLDQANLRRRYTEKTRIIDLVEARTPGVSQEALSLELRIAELGEHRKCVTEMLEELQTCKSESGRKEVFRNCENLYGTPHPRDVARGLDSEIRRSTSSLEKIEKRLSEAIRRASLSASCVVIDGSNLCYIGDRLVGLGPLLGLVVALRASRWPVKVVFDRSIMRLLERSFHSLRRAFGEMAEVHVMNSSASADEFILDLAGEINAIVISNDRFAEYPDKAVVKSGRVVVPEIFSGIVKIRDLDIVAIYDCPENEPVRTSAD